MMIVGVIAGVIGLASQRFDLAIMAGLIAMFGYLLTSPSGKGGADGGGGGTYQEGDGDCGGGD